MTSYLLQSSAISGSLAISPSMLKTPSVTNSFLLAERTSGDSKISFKCAISLWRYIFFFALESLPPSIIEAWLSSSDIKTSSGLVMRLWQVAVFEVKPDCITMESSVPLNSARRFSNSSCMEVVPIIVRTAAVPMPYFSVASTAALTTFGCVVRQR